MKISRCIICCLLLVVLASSLGAQGQDATSASAREFVQRFYRWYVPVALHDHRGASSDVALRDKKIDFGAELYRALKNDSDAQAKVAGEIVGLDFDPFLNTQDPCQRYELGKITKSGETYLVEVFGICSGKKNAQPDVVAEVRWADSRWQFVNFDYPNLAKDYPGTANLLATLKLLQAERQKSPQ